MQDLSNKAQPGKYRCPTTPKKFRDSIVVNKLDAVGNLLGKQPLWPKPGLPTKTSHLAFSGHYTLTGSSQKKTFYEKIWNLSHMLNLECLKFAWNLETLLAKAWHNIQFGLLRSLHLDKFWSNQKPFKNIYEIYSTCWTLNVWILNHRPTWR